MVIAVVGASGRSGKIFVDKALSQGHAIRAGYNSKNIFEDNPNLVAVQCDATNLNQVENLISNSDAVVCLIGHTRKSPARVQTQAIQTILIAMRKLGIKRLISLTGTGVRREGDKIPLIDYLLTFGVGIFDPNRVDDGIEHMKVLDNDQSDWTVLRVLKLQNNKPKPFGLSEHGPTKIITSRYEVAEAILEILGNGSFIRQAPIITKPLDN